MSPTVSDFSMSLQGTIVLRSLAIKQFSAPYPSLCHVGPDSFVLWIMGELGHEFAFSGESVEFFRGIHWLASQRLWAFAPNRRAIVFLRGPRGGCHAETNGYGHSDACVAAKRVKRHLVPSASRKKRSINKGCRWTAAINRSLWSVKSLRGFAGPGVKRTCHR
jgi:hypothetical protein